TRGNDRIDNLIRKSQLNASNDEKFLEWIEYSNFENIQHVADGGFGNVYKAIWNDGPIIDEYYQNKRINYQWDVEKSEWIRNRETLVAVKKYRNASSVTSEFLNE